jgi:hypothetical protein
MKGTGQMPNLSRTGLGFALTLAAMGAPFDAEAQTPNLVGTWKGTAYAVFLGSNPYRPSENRSANFPSAPLEFTFTIKEQQENRFSGESTAGGRTEQLVGAISPDNRSGVVLDNDGQYLFTIRDSATLDACYSHAKPESKVVSCYTWKRQK